MVRYQRAQAAGGTFFFTVTLARRQSDVLTAGIKLLRQSLRRIHQQRPFVIDAIVIRPEHLHTIWKLPAGDTDYATCWQPIETDFTRQIGATGDCSPRHANGEPALWQRRYWKHQIRDDTDYQKHIDYIHFNPVRHGYARHVADWPYSAFHRFVRQGLLPSDWGGNGDSDTGHFGERTEP